MKNKIYLALGLLALLLTQATSCNDFSKEMTFSKHMISRGAYQWVMINEEDSFLCNNIPDSLLVDDKKANVQFKFTGKMDTLYQVGPIDLPIFFRELPEIEIIDVRP
jgi:hypothetical protein